MATQRKTTVDVVKALIASLTPTFIINDATELETGIYKLDTFNTYWLHKRMKIAIDGAVYRITDFIIHEFITIKRISDTDGIPTVTKFTIPAPKFHRGVTQKATQEYASNKVPDRNPFVWLPERLNETEIRDITSIWGLKSQVRLFFMDESQPNSWTTDQHDDEIAAPMRELINYFFNEINLSSDLYEEVLENDRTMIADWGKEIRESNGGTKGNKGRYFDEYLSGLQVDFPFKMSKTACDPRPEKEQFDCEMSVSAFGVNETVENRNDGKAFAVPCNEVGPVVYSWTGPSGFTSSDQNIGIPPAQGLAPGIYTVTATDNGATDCVIVRVVTIAEGGAAPECTLVIGEFTVTGTTALAVDGTITANVSGGSGNYNYEWENEETGATRTGLSIGPYSVSVTDAEVDSSCHKSGSVSIPSLNVRYLFMDNLNDHLLFGSDIIVSGDWTFHMQFKVNTFEDPNAFTSLSNADIILTRSSTVIDAVLGNTARPFTVPLMSTNEWHHLAIVNNGTDMRLYFNGLESTTGGLSTAILKIVKIGQLATGSLPMGSGVDNFGIAPVAANPTQLTAIYEKPSTFFDVFPTATVFLKLNESGNDTIAVDETANGNDATATGYAAGATIWADRTD